MDEIQKDTLTPDSSAITEASLGLNNLAPEQTEAGQVMATEQQAQAPSSEPTLTGAIESTSPAAASDAGSLALEHAVEQPHTVLQPSRWRRARRILATSLSSMEIGKPAGVSPGKAIDDAKAVGSFAKGMITGEAAANTTSVDRTAAKPVPAKIRLA